MDRSRRKFRPLLLLAVSLVLLAPACARNGKPRPAPAPTRTYAMGFTPFPHDFTLAALAEAYAMIDADGDLCVYHFDNGVPWNEALANQPHPDEAEILAQRANAPAGSKILLDLTPIAITRDQLAPFPHDVPLTPPWDGDPFDHPDVVTAFRNYCEQMLAYHQPVDWLEIGTEANMLHESNPAAWAAYVSLASQTYASLKAAHPTLPVFISLQTDHYWTHHLDPPNATTGLTHAQAIQQLLASSDLVALSAYPIGTAVNGQVSSLPADFFDAVAALAPGKPFAIAETGWPAETIDLPFPVVLPSDPLEQQRYVQFLLQNADGHRAEFVNWFLTWDYDDLWNSGQIPLTPLNRFFRDIGLKDGVGADRPALTDWRGRLARPYVGG